MSNARNLSNLLGTGTTIATASIADDAITSAKLADDSVVAAAIATNAVASDALNIVGADLPVGTIGQVKNSQTSTTVTLPNNQNFSDAHSLTITPSSTTNKILVIATCAGDCGSGSYRALFWRILRGSTEIANTNYHMYASNETFHNIAQQPIVYLDSPASTSAQTYKIQGRNQTGSAFTGTYSGYLNQYNPTQLTLIEVIA